MPKYDFNCTACNSVTEMHMSYDATDRPKCDKCGELMSKTFTPPAVHFKGGGWGGQ